MLAQACALYGWTLDYCLNMPARQFFWMLEAGAEFHSHRMSELCDISIASSQDIKWYQSLKERYQTNKPELPPGFHDEDPQPKAGIDAKHGLMDMIAGGA